MKLAKDKIQALENLFRMTATTAEDAIGTRSLTPQEVSELKSLMAFIRAETPLPESLVEWLAQLGLLYGVPFNNLVVDEKLLSHDPTGENVSRDLKRLRETNVLRFFYLDMDWIDSLIDGAISIGTHNSKDFKLQQAIHKSYRPDIESEMLDHRLKVKGKPIVDQFFPEKKGNLSGFLLRSPLVTQWPGLEILGFTSKNPDLEDPDQKLDVLRMERLSMDIFLMIFKGVPESILIKEPSEAICSGLTYVGEDLPYRLALRQVRGENLIGKPLEKSGNTLEYELKDGDFRNKERRVLDVSTLRKSLTEALNEEDDGIGELSPKDMAVQFINSPRWYFFEHKS